jgi:hypothetical protein
METHEVHGSTGKSDFKLDIKKQERKYRRNRWLMIIHNKSFFIFKSLDLDKIYCIFATFFICLESSCFE